MGTLLIHRLWMRKLRHRAGRTPPPATQEERGPALAFPSGGRRPRVTVVRAELAWEALCPAPHAAGGRRPFLLCAVLLQ